MSNPLLAFEGLPAFDRVQAAHIAPAVTELLAQAKAALERVCAPDFPDNWRCISEVLDVATERLGRAWGMVNHINSVADTPELRAAYNAALPQVTAFYTQLGADERLYGKYKSIQPQHLDAAQQQALRNALRNFVLGGAELQGEDKVRFAALQERQAQLGQTFSENALDATDGDTLAVDEAALDGLPDDVRASARQLAQARGQSGYLLSLKLPCYLPVMQFATNRAVRERLYRAYVTRASDQAEGDLRRFDNAAVMDELLQLRAQEAQLLGFEHFAALSLAPKMADSPTQVLAFLRDLAARARPFALRDVADLREFAAQNLGLTDPQPWDWTFIGERLKEARYAYSEQEVKDHLPLPRVLAGLFALVERLFEVQIQPDHAPVWHPAVRFFRITRDGQTVGQFYLDPSARAGKRGGAWMDDVRSRWLRPDSGQRQTPLAHLVCNFAEGQDGQPPRLTHDDVCTLFHEFGHGLHHLLSQVDELDVTGISGVEWDAVELPSQFMENFCWEWSVLQGMSEHVQTGAAMPRALFDKMLAARNFQSGLQTLRQIEYALFDMQLHINPKAQVADVLASVRAEVAVLPAPAWARPAHTFSHIFAGGYAAGYYSYKWAEVLSADAYAAFEETRLPDGEMDVATGRRFRQEILERGGSRGAMASFVAFRGRAPQIDALLRHQGMAPAPEHCV